MRSTVLRHKVAAERGADPEQLREAQAYIQVRALLVQTRAGVRAPPLLWCCAQACPGREPELGCASLCCGAAPGASAPGWRR